jgi:hypothetical protein
VRRCAAIEPLRQLCLIRNMAIIDFYIDWLQFTMQLSTL